ncbi:Uncharacterised protein [Mycobacteroides abscessus subsp. abscessus]|nr:Uncharacterised protein [Mycobacteroides abscessus subsp. abscessus]
MRGGDIGVGVVDRVEELVGLADGALRRADRGNGCTLLADGTRDRRTTLIRAALGKSDLLRGKVDVVLNRVQRRRAVLLRQRRELAGGTLEARSQRDELLRDLSESGVSVDQQVAHLVEGRDLLVECGVDVGAGCDDLHQHRASFVGCLRDVVVESLSKRERCRETTFRRVERLREGCGLGWTELVDGQPQLLLAGADRVVGVGQDLARPGFEYFDRL